MNVSITFRHVDPSDALKRYATTKIAKLQKFLRQPMTAKVTLSVDRLKQLAEVRISSGGEHLEAKESSDDLYASIDLVLGKLERQVRASKGAQQAKRKGADSVRTSAPRTSRTASDAAPTPRAKKSVKKKKRAAKAS